MAAGDYDRVQMKEVITDGVSRVTNTVQDAMRTGDYSNLSRNVSAEMEALFSNIGRTVNVPFQQRNYRGQGFPNYNQNPAQNIPGYNNLTNGAGYMNTQTYHRVRDINQMRYQAAQGMPFAVPSQQQGVYQQPSLYRNMKGAKIGALIGAITGLFIGGTATFLDILLLIGSIASGDVIMGLFACAMLFTIFGLGPLVGGILGVRHIKKISRFEKYLKGLNGKTYAPIEMLSEMTEKSKDFTIKDLQQMFAKGWFTQGHIDEKGETLITSEETYQQYLHTLQVAAERAAEEREKAAEEAAEREKEYGGLSEAQYEIIKQGEQYIAEIRKCNDEIPGEVVTEKLDRMIHSVEMIVDRAKQQPELTDDMQRLMNYYLPTMVKLLHTYADLDHQGKSSANIEKSKKEIEDTIDVMNEAFDRLFDSLFEDTSLDIATDVEVMKTLLSQEGLTGHSFTSNQTIPGTGDQTN